MRRAKRAKVDVAIIGAGSYALPLAVYMRDRYGATAIVQGGGLQLQFGVMRHRWRNCKGSRFGSKDSKR